MDAKLKFTVNGKDQTVETDPQRPLLDVLREDLHLNGAKFGCGEGRCGACSVLVDGRRIFSCSTQVKDVEGKEVLTIEGLAIGEELHPVQQAFIEEGAFQCGYCTAGMIMNAVALLKKTPKPSSQEIREGMNGNLCRCCHYEKILKAVQRAATPGAEVRS